MMPSLSWVKSAGMKKENNNIQPVVMAKETESLSLKSEAGALKEKKKKIKD